MKFTPVLQSLSSIFPTYPVIEKDSLPLTVMILSPHPDDESIISSLALRLQKENGAHIINVCATLGSKKERKKDRLEELKKACLYLEMELVVLDEDWKFKVKELKSLIQKYQPHLILAPHSKDHHVTHIKTSKLLTASLKGLKLKTLVAWTEFWGYMEKPNLMVEVPVEIVENQMTSLELHVGEIIRNPYHLRLPAWLMDNVRRGSEIIEVAGSPAVNICFGAIYKLELFKNGKFSTPKLSTNILTSLADIGQIFSDILAAAPGSKTKVK